MRILIFGDSIAYGEFDSRGGWATRLYLDYLNQYANDLQGDLPFIFNLSVGSETTRGVINRLPHEAEGRQYPGEELAFVFAIGINDARRRTGGEYVSSPEQYAKDLRELHDEALRYGRNIIVVGLTPVEDDKFGHQKYTTARIWEFEQVLRDFAKEKKLPFVPLFEVFQDEMRAGKGLFVDGLHPNDAGHDIMYQQIKPILITSLKA